MTNIDSRIERLDSKFDRRISRLEDKLVPSDQLTGMKVESVEEDRHDYNSPPAAGVTAQESNEEQSSSPGNSNGPDSQKVADAQELLRRMDHDNLEKDPGEPVHPGQPSLPAGHTTLAAFLLKWPSIKALVHEPLAKEGILHINDFPVGQEQQRGPLRVWGRGEGYFAGNKHDNQVMTDLTGDSPSANVDAPSPYSDSAISTDRDAWGPVGLPATQGVEVYKGGMPANEGLFDRAHVKQYVKSFEDNVLNMHPILIPKQLHAMVTIFLDQLPQANPKPTKNPAKFVQTIGPSNSHAGTDSGLKRKRSPALDDQSPGIAYQKSGVPNRSIESALVLAVLALGKICLWKSKIPELVPDHEPAAYSSPSVRNGTLSSPAQGSPPGLLSTQASSLPSPKEPERSLSSRRPSLQGANPGLRGQNVKRNLDVIPGLEYFGMAADILGTHMGEFNLKSVYTALFLGLYHGQLGRVLESWSYIALAGRQLQVVLRP